MNSRLMQHLGVTPLTFIALHPSRPLPAGHCGLHGARGAAFPNRPL